MYKRWQYIAELTQFNSRLLFSSVITGVDVMNIFYDAPEVFIHTQFVDFRKSINGLVGIVEAELARDAYTGTLFVFCNKAKDKLKILYWDKTGFALWYKRLEKQKFKWPTTLSSQEFELTSQQLSWLLSGYDVLGHEPLHYQSMI